MATDITDYRDIFLNDRPMMDTRAPVEFAEGRVPGRGQPATDDR